MATELPTMKDGTPTDQSCTNTIWLAPPKIIEDINIASRIERPLVIAITPKTKPNGKTPK